MMRYLFLSVLVLVFSSEIAGARDEIRIVGSSEALPYVRPVAENFTYNGGYSAPSLEVTGTGNGFRLFCAGIGFEYPDINATARRMTDAEFTNCQTNGVKNIIEIVVGLDGIVLANSKATKQYNFTTAQLFCALAAEVEKNGQIVKNTNVTWQAIDPSLPRTEIEVMGPPPTSGIYDAFMQLIMEAGCKDFSRVSKLPPSRRFDVCRNVRKDGGFVMGIKNEHLAVKWLQERPGAFGIIPFSLWQENGDIIAANRVNGVFPTAANISDGSYALSRPIYLYVKTKHVDAIQGLQRFLYEFTSERAIGPDGYLADKGFIPLDDRGRNSARDFALSLTPMTR